MTRRRRRGSDSSRPETDSVRRQVYQARASDLEQLTRLYSIHNNNLFVIIGPPAAGKSAVQRLMKPVSGVSNIIKEQTRAIREMDDDFRRRVSKSRFKKTRKKGGYIFSYTTQSAETTPTRDSYGIPKRNFMDTMSLGDGIIAFNNIGVYRQFLRDPDIVKMTGQLNIIPVVITADDPEDLITRLGSRECHPSEKQARLRLATENWSNMGELESAVEHIILNNTPPELKKIPLDCKVPMDIEVLAYSRIDDAAQKFTATVGFYKTLKGIYSVSDMSSIPDIDVHEAYLNWVTSRIFNRGYKDIMQSIADGTPVPVRREEMKRAMNGSGDSAQMQYIFANLQAVECRVSKEGIMTLKLNDVINKRNAEDGKRIFEALFPKEHGRWATTKTRRYSLTDVPYTTDKRKVYAVDIKVVP